MRDYYGLGPYQRVISTTSKDAQLWFDRGLMWCYGFNHDESVACYQKAIDADKNCAVAFWGIAMRLAVTTINHGKPLTKKTPCGQLRAHMMQRKMLWQM